MVNRKIEFYRYFFILMTNLGYTTFFFFFLQHSHPQNMPEYPDPHPLNLAAITLIMTGLQGLPKKSIESITKP